MLFRSRRDHHFVDQIREFMLGDKSSFNASESRLDDNDFNASPIVSVKVRARSKSIESELWVNSTVVISFHRDTPSGFEVEDSQVVSMDHNSVGSSPELVVIR